MLITCALVTHAPRRPWLQAWAEQIRRQTYRPLETLILDDSPEPLSPLPAVPGLSYHHLPGASIGARRNAAMDHASGEYLAWFDDDDSHAPHRLALLHGRITEGQGADIATPTQLAFANVTTRLCHLFTQPHHPLNISALYRLTWIRRHRFPERQGPATDTPWLQAILAGARVVRMDELLSVAWCHADNIANPVQGSRWTFDKAILPAWATGLTLPQGGH